MARVLYILIGVVVLSLVTFGNPLAGNVFGFCPPSEGPKAIAIDVLVALVDGTALWLLYRGVSGSATA